METGAISIHPGPNGHWIFLLSVARGFCNWPATWLLQKPRQRERERERERDLGVGEWLLLLGARLEGSPVLRTCFSLAVLSRAKAMESSTARRISCTFDPFLPSDSLDIPLLLFRPNHRNCLAETFRNNQQVETTICR